MIDIFLEVMRLKTMQNERSWLWKAEPVSEGGAGSDGIRDCRIDRTESL